MPIRGDRLRWPPRPGKKSSETSGTRRALLTDEARLLRRPDERDESAEHHSDQPRRVIQQAHDDIEGQQDTDCRNQASDVIAQSTRDKAANKR